VVIVDTAGRLSIDEALMTELSEVAGAVKPNETFLVLDAATGQEAVNVAQAFHERVPLTGAIFTKLDGDTRGGAVLSVREATGVPVRFAGIGEQVDAIEPFDPKRMAERILGMGDVLGIIEKVEQAVDLEDIASLEEKMKSGKLDFNDFLSQMRTVKRMGPLKNVMKMIPGMAAQIDDEALEQLDDRRLDHLEAMILSMTPSERSNPDILNGSRRRRIARGSGRTPQEVNQLVEQLFTMRKSIKQMGQMQRKMRKMRRR
ncbi:MAG: signal recognition particle protein, partial [Fimbriimonadaceae bacterium]|nr:signal recognition particle protein [Fimbriimonadaceae bacterium]